MRVALLCLNYPPEFTGGTERVTRALASALVARGEDVVVICGSDVAHDGEDVLRQEVDGIAVLRLPRRDDEGYGLELQRPRLRALTEGLLREFDIEVVHLHHWSTLSLETLRMARDLGCGTVATTEPDADLGGTPDAMTGGAWARLRKRSPIP